MNDESEVSVRVTDQHLFLRHTARARDGVDAHEVKHQFRLDELSLPPEFPLDFVQTLVVAYLPGRLALRAPTVDVRGVWWSLLTALTCIRQRVSTEMPHCEARLAMLSLVRLDYEPRYCVVDNNRLLVYASLFAYRNVPTKPEDSIDLAVATLVTDGELLPKGDLVFALIIRSNVAQEKRYFFDPASADQRRMWIEVIRLSQKRFAMRKTGGSKSVRVFVLSVWRDRARAGQLTTCALLCVQSLAIAMNAVGTIERAFYKRRPNVRSMREERERERATVQDILVRWRYYKDRIQTAKLQRWVLLASALQQEADSHVDDGETQAQGVHGTCAQRDSRGAAHVLCLRSLRCRRRRPVHHPAAVRRRLGRRSSQRGVRERMRTRTRAMSVADARSARARVSRQADRVRVVSPQVDRPRDRVVRPARARPRGGDQGADVAAAARGGTTGHAHAHRRLEPRGGGKRGGGRLGRCRSAGHAAR